MRPDSGAPFLCDVITLPSASRFFLQLDFKSLLFSSMLPPPADVNAFRWLKMSLFRRMIDEYNSGVGAGGDVSVCRGACGAGRGQNRIRPTLADAKSTLGRRRRRAERNVGENDRQIKEINGIAHHIYLF